jgi:flagellar assembly factor FliW
VILEVVSPILGFESVKNFEFKPVDDNFAQIHSTSEGGPAFSLVNPFFLRSYNFEVSDELQTALELSSSTKYFVFCIMVLKKPFTDSLINFLAPIIINVDSKKIAQIVLDDTQYPFFNTAEPLSKYIAK